MSKKTSTDEYSNKSRPSFTSKVIVDNKHVPPERKVTFEIGLFSGSV